MRAARTAAAIPPPGSAVAKGDEGEEEEYSAEEDLCFECTTKEASKLKVFVCVDCNGPDGDGHRCGCHDDFCQ